MSAAQQAGAPVRSWSPRQEAIFAALAELQPAQHLVIEALAGTGKSTTIEECVERTPPSASVLVCAFNKSIANAMQARLPGDCDVMTLHSLGMRIVMSAMSDRFVANEPKDRPVSKLAREILGSKWESMPLRRACEAVVSLAKGTLTEHEPAALDALADAYGVELPPEPWVRERILAAAARILDICADADTGPIDFDDMIWLPAVRDLPAPTWDFVFVDETQDLNAAQLSLVQRVAGDEGRIIAVGDRRQAIYGFRGADRQAIPRMIAELRARTLPLDITYRCPRLVVREANGGTRHTPARLVPELQAAPSAPEGIVRTATEEELRAGAQAGDMVLSRTNAPLVSLCYAWLAAGRKAVIQGRDIGAGLVAWIKAHPAASVGQLERIVDDWCGKEVKRLTEAERDTQSTIDKAECLHALCEGCERVEDVIAKCERLFADTSAAGAILLSSTHRAKGLEAPRVWLLRDTYCRWKGAEEENLLYVAITRSKGELIYVYGKDDEGTHDNAWADSEDRC